jgi:hypothetical protein
VVFGEGFHPSFDMLDKSWGLTTLKVGNEPFIFIVATCWAAKPNTVAADDDKMGGIRGCHGGDMDDLINVGLDGGD